MILTNEQQRQLLKLARQSIEQRFNKIPLDLPSGQVFQNKYGVFVTLHKHEDLRGCIGYIKGYRDLVSSVAEMSQAAAFRDPRFNSVTKDEMQDIKIEISILSEMIPVKDITDIVIGRDGLYLENPYGSGLLLPQVATEWNWDVPQFLKQICYKSGLDSEAWKDKDSKLYRFSAEIFSE